MAAPLRLVQNPGFHRREVGRRAKCVALTCMGRGQFRLGPIPPIRDTPSVMDGTYLFAAGGTGGHLFPAIAVARALLRRQPSARVLFVGTDRALERDILTREGFPHHALPAASTAVLKRNPAGFAWRHWTACRAARRLLA